MIKLERPLHPVGQLFADCIRGIEDDSLKRRLEDVASEIVDASDEFDVKAAGNLLHQFAHGVPAGNQVTRTELTDVYTHRMARKHAPGRPIYDELLRSAPLDKCPLCAHREVATLDHHLPKGKYPALAVTPLNLVPACYACNKAKQSAHPTSAGEETLHPYYDDLGGVRWLHGDVKEENPAAVLFSVATPASWSPILAERVNHHFQTFNLAPLYSAQAANELLNIRHQLVQIFSLGGAATVKSEMRNRAASSRMVCQNDWRTVTYEAFEASTWFCNGGFM